MLPMPTEDAKPPQMKLRSGTLDSDRMTRSLETLGYRTYPPYIGEIRAEPPADAMPRIKDAGPVFEESVVKLIGREPIHTCKRTDEQFQRSFPHWTYTAWLTDEEWMLIRMKCF